MKKEQHGYSSGKRRKEYRIWCLIKGRCLSKSNPKYYMYGARGIKICERWMKFSNFINDMGDCPPDKHSIDRIDNNGNYEPGNCRWANIKEQNTNTRRTVKLTYNGKTQCLKYWALEFNLNPDTIRSKLRKGFSIEECLKKPKRIFVTNEMAKKIKSDFNNGKTIQELMKETSLSKRVLTGIKNNITQKNIIP